MDTKDLQYSFSSLLGAETIIRRQKRNEKIQKKNQFISIIKKYDEALMKSIVLQSEFMIDLSTYEDVYFSIIDEVLILKFGEDIYQLISFYFYGRKDIETGEDNYIEDELGNEIYIRTPEDLYHTIEKLYPNTFS